jgi:hypothetical protein
MSWLDGLGPEWVDDDGLRPDCGPDGLVAMPVSSAGAWSGDTNRSRGVARLRADSRWRPFELWSYDGRGRLIRRGEPLPAGATFTGIVFDHPSSLDQMRTMLGAAAGVRAGRAVVPIDQSSGSVVGAGFPADRC